MPYKCFICAWLTVILAFYGCGKKKSKETESIIDSIKTTSLSTEQKSDDIFKEFYDEEGDKKGKKKSKSTNDFPTPSDVQFNPNGRYVVQVSCVLSKKLAQNIASKLANKGYPAYIAEVENPTPELLGIYHRVRIGGFNGVSTAKSFAESNLTGDGYEYWIDNRSNDNVGMGGRGLGESSGSDQSPYQSYQQPATPATQTTPAPWKTTEPTPSTPQKSEATQPSITPSDDWDSNQQTTPATPTQPTYQESKPQKTEPPVQQPEPTDKSPFNDEWGADTTNW